MLSASLSSCSVSLFSFACISTEISLHMHWPAFQLLQENFSSRRTFCLLTTVTAPESATLPKKLSVDICWLDEGGLPWQLSGKKSAYQAGDLGSILGEISWLRKSQPIPVFLTEKYHGQRSMVGYSSWGCRRVRCDQQQQPNEDISDELHDISFPVIKN